MSRSGDGITYWPLAHLPRSMVRQRSLQKGNSGSELFTGFLQIGQRNLTVGLAILYERPGIHDLYDPRYQVIVVRFDEFTTVELAGLRFLSFRELVDEHLAVDFRGMHRRPALQQQVCFL